MGLPNVSTVMLSGSGPRRTSVSSASIAASSEAVSSKLKAIEDLGDSLWAQHDVVRVARHDRGGLLHPLLHGFAKKPELNSKPGYVQKVCGRGESVPNALYLTDF